MCTEEDCKIFMGKIRACDNCPMAGVGAPAYGFVQRAEKDLDVVFPAVPEQKLF